MLQLDIQWKDTCTSYSLAGVMFYVEFGSY